MTEVAVVDLGVGNTASVLFALERLGARAVLTADAGVLADAERVVFPGVGSAGYAARRLAELGLTETLRTFPRPLMGVCLGMQMLFEGSDEGDAPGLGRMDGRVERLEGGPDLPVPHMGWSPLRIERDDPLLEGVEDGAHAYFVHSYARLSTSGSSTTTIATGDYAQPFAAIVRDGTVCGCQFHPERSGPVGAQILRNFLRLPC